MNVKESAETVVLREVNAQIMSVDMRKDPMLDPKLHLGLRPFYITVRQELGIVQGIYTENRRAALRKLLTKDFLQQNDELRAIGLSYINTQP